MTPLGQDAERRLAAVAHELRSWNAVTIIGAGASLMSGFPLTQQLRPLVWQALDADESARSSLARRFTSSENGAKALIGDDPLVTDAAYELIGTSSTARSVFQNGFARLDAEKAQRFSPAYDALAELLHRRAIESIVSFNWDTLLESAYRRRYGRTLRAGDLWLSKPHGDAAVPEQPWILPNEAGYVPEYLVEHFSSLALQRPRVLLIIGYSERDAAVVRTLIAPFEQRWRVIRIGPSASGADDIPLPADEALPMLVQAVAPMPEAPGWEYVNFSGQRNIGAALSGIRLGAADVEACPRLPEVETVKQALHTAGSAIVVGGAGHGKSITAYQAAYDLSKDGWEVVRVTQPDRSSIELTAAITNLPWQTVAIIDDAQTLDAEKVERMVEHASPKLYVLVASNNEFSFRTKSIVIASERAVRVLAEAMAARRGEVLPIVQKLDKRVGDGYIDEPLERRIEDAVRAATQKEPSPWLFCFALTGGWKRATDQVALLREANRADLLLAAVASRQLLLLDSDVDIPWLERAAQELGRDRSWVASSLAVARRHQAIVGKDRWRCPHARYAMEALRVICSNPADAEWSNIQKLLRTAIRYETPTLRGIDRLLFDVWFASGFLRGTSGVIDNELLRYLQERCWMVDSPEERRDAGFLLRTLLRWRQPEQLADINSHQDQLVKWLEEANPISMIGLSWLLNDTYNDAEELAIRIFDQVSPGILAKRFMAAAIEDAYRWTFLVGRLALSEAWRQRFNGELSREVLLGRCSHVPADTLFELMNYIEGVGIFDKTTALEMFDHVVPTLASALNRSPIESFQKIYDDVIWHVLGFYPHFLRQRQPSASQKAVARTLVRALDPAAIANDINNAKRRSWRDAGQLLLFIGEVDRRQCAKVVRALDLEKLDAATVGLWSNVPHELEILLRVIAEAPDCEPSRSWIARHSMELDRLTGWLAVLSPVAVANAMRKGKTIDLEIGLNWTVASLAVKSLAEEGPDLARQALEQNRDKIKNGLLLPSKDASEELESFVASVNERVPGYLESVLRDLNPSDAEINWTARLGGKSLEKRAVAALLPYAARSGGSIAELATKLMNTRGRSIRKGPHRRVR